MSINRTNYIVFNGQNSNEFDLAITGMQTYNSPERDYTLTSIKGRNGDIFVDNHRYKNITVEYTAVIGSTFKDKLPLIREWLLSPNGYARLQDTYNIGTINYREAIYSGSVDFSNVYDQGGTIKLKFNCKPQIFISENGQGPLNISDREWTFDSLYWLESKPLLHLMDGTARDPSGWNVYGDIEINGARILINYTKVSFDEIPTTFQANTYYQRSDNADHENVYQPMSATTKAELYPSVQYYVRIANPAKYMYIDCETFNAYGINTSGALLSRNKYVTFEGEPKIHKGSNIIYVNDLSYRIRRGATSSYDYYLTLDPRSIIL